MARKSAPFVTLLMILSHLTSTNSTLVDTTIIQSKHTLGSTSYSLDALCLHPTDTNIIYATTKHALISFDWNTNPDVAVVTVEAGGNSDGFHDAVGTSAKLAQPSGCTIFEGGIAIADMDNDALRKFKIQNKRVTTIIRQGADGSDGPYTISTSTGGGVLSPNFIEAVNSTHLVVAQEDGKVRLIDTQSKAIKTLMATGSLTSFSNFFFDYEREGIFGTVFNDGHYVLYYFPLRTLLDGDAETSSEFLRVQYNRTSTSGAAANGSPSESVIVKYTDSFAADVGEYLILPNVHWLDVIDKRTHYTTVYTAIADYPQGIILVPGNPGYLYATDDHIMVRLEIETTTPTATTTTTQSATTTTTTEPTTTSTITEPTTTTTTTEPTTTTTTIELTTITTTTTTAEPATTTTTIEPTTTTTTAEPATTTATTESTITTATIEPTTTPTAAKPTTTTTTPEQFTTSATTPAGIQKYKVELNSLCPSTATKISEKMVENSQICSLHCTNVVDCAGFNFNKQTGKCRLLKSWDSSNKYLAGAESDRCYMKDF